MSPIVQVRKGLTVPMSLHPTMLRELGKRAFVDLHAENDVDLVTSDGVTWCELEIRDRARKAQYLARHPEERR